MTKRLEYQCPRCGYTIHRRPAMRKHLYGLKKECPASLNNITITDDIKECILINRVYHIPVQKSEASIINQTINNYHQINNLIANMDTVEKILKYTGYKNIELLDFEDHIDEQYHKHVKRLDAAKYDNFTLNIQSIMEVIDRVTSMMDVSKFNILYDEIPNKLKMFCCGEWQCMLLEAGIRDMIEKIKVCYLDHYECYLLRKIYDDANSPLHKQQMKEHLLEYYKFIACFNIQPFVIGSSNNMILYPSSDSRHHASPENDFSAYSIEEEWQKRYNSIKDRIALGEANKIKREVQLIIKKNTKASLLELNKRMMEIIQMDESFKKEIIDNITCMVAVANPDAMSFHS